LHREDERTTTLLKLWTDYFELPVNHPQTRTECPQPTLLAWATRVVPCSLLIPHGSAERRPLPSVGS
jgi:hypothetical protein